MLARGPVLRRVAHQSGLRGHGLGDQAKAGRARYERARMADTPCWWAIPAGTRAARQRSRDCPSQRRRLDRTGDSAEREQRCQRFGYRTRRPIKRSGTSPRRPSCLEPSSRNGRALVPPYAASQRSRPIGNSRAPRPRRRAIAAAQVAACTGVFQSGLAKLERERRRLVAAEASVVASLDGVAIGTSIRAPTT